MSAVEMRVAPTQHRATKRVEAIAAATRLAIARFGKDHFTTSDVARLGGMSVGVIYRYFPDRLALLEHVYPGGYLTVSSEGELTQLTDRPVVLDPTGRAWQAGHDTADRFWTSVSPVGEPDAYTDFELVALFGTLRVLHAAARS